MTQRQEPIERAIRVLFNNAHKHSFSCFEEATMRPTELCKETRERMLAFQLNSLTDVHICSKMQLLKGRGVFTFQKKHEPHAWHGLGLLEEKTKRAHEEEKVLNWIQSRPVLFSIKQARKFTIRLQNTEQQLEGTLF